MPEQGNSAQLQMPTWGHVGLTPHPSTLELGFATLWTSVSGALLPGD